jgi:integrase
MATIRRRGAKWQVQIRRLGRPGVSRTFFLKSDAQAWAHQKELDAERRGLATEHKSLRNLLVAEILLRYRDEVVPRKLSRASETVAINAFLRHPLAQVAITSLTTGMVSAYCNQRYRSVKASTVNRELDIYRHALVVARRDWDMPLMENPFAAVIRKKSSPPRTRRLQNGERERLNAVCAQCQNRYMPLLVRFALETGMRRGELLSARWENLSLDTRTLHIEHTKNGHPRTIPLSSDAVAVIRSLEKLRDPVNPLVVPLTMYAVKMSWKRIVKRAGLKDLRFHDLRHEAVSRFFERGLSVPEVALISGHRDPRMLFRYTHPRAELIAQKLK